MSEAPTRILVVEDEGIIALDLRRRLTHLGYAIAGVTATADEAVALAERERPDLVLMDINLRGRRDGVSAAEEIQERFGIPVIYLTAYADDRTLERARVTAPFGYLIKPFQERELHIGIEIALERHRLEQALLERERWSRQLLESAPDAMVIVDPAGTIVLVNGQAEALFGYPRADLLGQPIEMLVPPRLRIRHREHRAAYAKDAKLRPMGMGRELFGRRQDGTEFPVEISLSPIEGPDGKLVVGAIRDVSERRRSQQELARRAAELERSNAELSQFANLTSHDLQEPARLIANYLDLLSSRHGSALDTEAQEYLRTATREAVRMRSLLQDILDYSRLGASEPAEEQVDSREILELALADLADAIRSSGASIRVGEMPVLAARPSELLQLFRALLENAIKFRKATPPEIRVEGRRSERHWLFSIRDNGIGVPPDQQARIFRIFQRLNPSGAFPGTGVGLAICKKIVEQRGGRIWVDSEPGEGSIFCFTVPLASRAGTGLATHTAGDRPAGTTETGTDAREVDVLLVEDNPGDVRLTVEALRETSSSIRVIVAVDGIDALEKLRGGREPEDLVRPRAILLDLNLPRLGGWELLEELRRDESLSRIPVVILSGSNRQADRERAGALGGVRYLCKPSRYEDLVEAVRSVEHVWAA